MKQQDSQPISTLLLQQQDPENDQLAQIGNYRLAICCTGKKVITTPPTLVDNDGVEFNSPHQT